MLRGVATVSFFAADVSAASEWYAHLLGIQPYFVRPVDGPPAYVEFRLGDDQVELGIVDSRYARHATDGPAGAVLYWQVDDLPAAVRSLLDLGATALDPISDRGNGFRTASVVDPFGNVLGVMDNPHYVSVRAGRAEA